MGRLFWKFFFFVWLSQVTAILGIGGTIWLEHRNEPSTIPQAPDRGGPERGAFPPDRPPFEGGRPPPGEPPPGSGDRPPPRAGDRPPQPPPGGGPKFQLYLPMMAGLLASLIFAALLARYFSKPIRNLRSAFDAAAEGNLDVRAGPQMGKRRDELADLGRDFDMMSSRLQALMDAQRRLLHDVSHELRSPLARLQAAIGLARQQPDKIGATLDRIERESVRMDKLVGELLTLSRLEAGVTGALNEEINIGELLAEIVDDAQFEAHAGDRQVELVGNCDVLLLGRFELLSRAIENVVRNALKYTAAGGKVTVQAGASAGSMKIAVLDQGPGIPESEIAAIFDPFFRGSTGAASIDGHGLGLAIAQRVVAAHGGTIRAANRAGGGLCVEIVLPLKAGLTPA